MCKSEEKLEGWSFVVDEVSAGVYRASGVDRLGRSVGTEGTDPDTLLDHCRVLASEMMMGLRGNKPPSVPGETKLTK